MSTGGKGVARPYSVIIPIELLLALAIPVGAVLLFDLYQVPLALFVMASVPGGVALYLHGFLPVPRSAVLIASVCYVAGGLLSTIISSSPSFVDFASLVLNSLLILYFLFLLSLVPHLTRADSNLLILTMVLACGANAGLNAILFFMDDPRTILPTGRFVPAIGTPGGRWPTAVSAAYAVLFSAAFAQFASAAQGWIFRVLAGAAAISIGTALVLTQARSGYLATVAAMAVIVPHIPRRERMVVLFLVGGVILICLYPPFFDAVFTRGMSYRTDIWMDYLRWAAESPIIGRGFLEDIHRMIDGTEIFHAHNLLISALVRGGLLGLVGMAVMLGAGLYWAWSYARRFKDPVFLAMVVALFVYGMFDYELLPAPTEWTWVAFWLPIGLAAGTELAARGVWVREATA